MTIWICKEVQTDNGGYIEPIRKLTRCADCKYCRTYYHGESMPFSYACDKLYLTSNLSSDDYCSRAVRSKE